MVVKRKKLRIGLIGCGLMGRIHTNGYKRIGDFFPDSVVRGWRSIHVSDSDQPYMERWWIPGTSIGYEHTFINEVADFIKSLETGEACSPTFREALEPQKVCQAVLDSAASKSWENNNVQWEEESKASG